MMGAGAAARPVPGRAAAGFAIAVPALLAFNLPPSATFFNQAAALLGWGVWLALLTRLMPTLGAPWPRGIVSLNLALTLILSAALASPWFGNLPWALALSSLSLVCAAVLTTVLAAAPPFANSSHSMFRALCVALAFAGLASSAIGVIQVFTPTFADGNWIARTVAEGRAVGNLRQSNHLCSLMLWSIAAVLWLGEAAVFRRAISIGLAALMLFVIVLSGSRSGVLGALLLALWGLLDKRVAKPTRSALLCAPLAFGLFWISATAWAEHSHQAFGGAARFGMDGDISSSRFGIWANTLQLIKAHPWTGVGFGEFNFAWTLTEFPGRPVAFFDHTHNLPLQFAVELGLPLASVVLGLLGWALWCAARNCLRPVDASQGASPQRAAFVMVLLVLVHSLLEYPLWYAYFLLPAAFALGLCLADPSQRADEAAPPPRTKRPALGLRLGSAALILGAAYSVYDYLSVVVIFAPPENAAPLVQRIAKGQRSVFFSHHADYAAATTSDDPATALAAAQRAAHYLLDTRLMMAWANALHATGDTERAKYIARRLKEFRNPQSVDYFAPCSDPGLAEAHKPYQCFAPQRKFTFKDFR